MSDLLKKIWLKKSKTLLLVCFIYDLQKKCIEKWAIKRAGSLSTPISTTIFLIRVQQKLRISGSVSYPYSLCVYRYVPYGWKIQPNILIRIRFDCSLFSLPCLKFSIFLYCNCWIIWWIGKKRTLVLCFSSFYNFLVFYIFESKKKKYE